VTLPADYLADVERRARRFQGQWTGSEGGLAADVIRLLKERAELMSQLDTIDCGPVDTTSTEGIPSDWILRGDRELRQEKTTPRLKGDGLLAAKPDQLRPGSLAFMEVIEEIRQLHLAKTQDYGADSDALKNIRDGADVVGIEPWKACLIRMADKMTRLRSYCHNGRVEFDGVEDTLKDLAAYAIIAEVLRRESTRPAT
jgi:hypothetical protein